MQRPWSSVEVSTVVQRSRFIAVAVSCSSLDQVKELIRKRRKGLPKARHHCWACRITTGDDNNVLEQARDDGEVGRPGMVLLEILRGRQLENVALVVSRVFGGVKLGPGGVSRAFREAGQRCLENLPIESDRTPQKRGA